jgi:hypothetical protein
METLNIQQATTKRINKTVLTGKILFGLCVVFLFVDAIMKVVINPHAVKGTADLGWSEAAVQPIGILLLICTILYAVPRTTLIGAILLTGYLGGAVATMARIGVPFAFPLIMGILVWLSLYLRNEKFKAAFTQLLK